ncbi:MAG: TlpA disulfide reductase family protein, partial [Planctomycetota bacterium]
TFLTTVGDYRFLSGSFEGGRLRLSCFDGAHAFLFDAVASRNGMLRGDFWSRDSYHTTWIGNPDDKIELPDPFSISHWNSEVTLDSMAFTEPTQNGNGKRAALGDERFHGKARILQVFGSWCPNCHDETNYLKELHERYSKEGLSIAAVAFELTGNSRKDLEQLSRYVARMAIPYPVLYGGVWSKEKATMTFGGLDRIHAYPTTIFFDQKGNPAAVYTGFTGPAAPIQHERLRASFDKIIQSLLAGEPSPIGTPVELKGKDPAPKKPASKKPAPKKKVK